MVTHQLQVERRTAKVRWPKTDILPTQLPLQKGHSPQFSAHVRCGQTAGWIKIPLGMEVGLLDGQSAPPKRGGGTAPTQFSAHVCCGQMAGWIKVPLGTEVGLGQGHTVR